MAKLFDTFRDLPHKLHLSGGKVKASDKQLKQYKEFHEIKQGCKLGFPDGATATAYDKRLKLLAVGTEAGDTFVFGAPGVEFFASHGQPAAEVKRVVFLPNEGRLVTLTSDNKLHKWELNGSETEAWHLDRLGTLEAGPVDEDRVTAIGLVDSTNSLWLGYHSGKVRFVDVKAWKFTEAEVTGESLGNSLPDATKAILKGWGSIVAIEAAQTKDSVASAAAGEHNAEEQATEDPAKPLEQLVAIGFRSGSVLLVTAADAAAVKRLAVCQQSDAELECLTWRPSEDHAAAAGTLVTGYSDGAYTEWDVEGDSLLAKPRGDRRIPYGPFPCQPITHIATAGPLLAFAGGLPKNTHADRQSVTLESGDKHQVCFELPGTALGLALLTGEEQSFLALSSSRLLAIDLADADWKPLRPPYLRSLADSLVTVARVYGRVSDLPEALRAAIDAAAADAGDASAFSNREWPLTGGHLVPAEATEDTANDRHLLATGHADGSVAFWLIDGRRGLGRPIARLDTAQIFELTVNGTDGVAEDAEAAAAAFPSLKRVGADFPSAAPSATIVDPRLAIFGLDLIGEALVVSGAGGQAIVWSPTADAASSSVQLDIRTVHADLLAARTSAYEWTGPAGLQVRTGSIEFGRPFRPSCIALVEPPAPVTSVAYSQRWGILAVGTAHGMAVVDTRGIRLIEARLTLPAPVHATANGEADPASGSEESGLTKSLRQSFRKLKKLRPGKKQEYTVNSGAEKKEEVASAKQETAAEAEKNEENAEGEKAEDGAEKTGEESEKKPEDAEEKKPDEDEEKKDETPEKPDDAEKKVDEAEEAAVAGAHPAPEKKKLSPLDSRPAGQIGALLLAEITLVSASTPTACLIAGDASGHVYFYQLILEKPPPKQAPEAEKKTDEADEEKANEAGQEAETEPKWNAQLTKELSLRHGASVAEVYALSARDHSRITDNPAPDGPQELLVISEEQVKIFALPSLKPRNKARLSARLVSCGHAAFASASRTDAREIGLAARLEDGSLLVLGLPALRVHAWQTNFTATGVDVAFCCCCDRAAGIPVAVVLETGASGAAVVAVHQLAGKLDAAFTRAAGLTLPEGARKSPETAASTEAPAASATVSAPAEEAAAPVVNGEEAKAEDKEDGGVEAAAGAGAATGPVAADITMDDIKEYATGNVIVSTAETIPEDKRESTVSSGGNGGEASATPTPTAEVKTCGGEVPPVNAETPSPAIAGPDHSNSTTE